MRYFLDTSAILPFMDADDPEHPAVADALRRVQAERGDLVTTNYVVVEATALCQRRLGMSIARNFLMDVVPLLDVRWLAPDVHELAVGLLLRENRRDLGVVDCASIEVMRQLGIGHVVALDRHFREYGFECVP